MKKSEMSAKAQIGHIRAERDILTTSDNLWIVELKESFQVTSSSRQQTDSEQAAEQSPKEAKNSFTIILYI